ncbi:MAG: T9SS type A sorting domain-containing protein [Candidatus Kapaibacterium sp.]
MTSLLRQSHMSRWGLAIMLFCIGFTAARGQVSFERVYAEPGGSGVRGITTQTGCGGSDFISVGSRTVNGTNNDVYVVATKGDGTVIWAQSYDIGGVGNNDYGNSIVSMGSANGYTITGVTQAPGFPMDIFVMQIDCNGNVIWLKTFGEQRVNDWANDIQTAPALSGNGTQDLVVAGWRNTSSTNHDALLFRLTSTGVVLWERTYDLGGSERFNALTITKVGANANDIVAVGHRIAPGQNAQGFMMRVGTNGLIGAAPQGAAEFGPPGSSDFFRSVIELTTIGPDLGKLVAIGETNASPSGDWDVYVVKSQSYPCSNLGPVQSRIGNTFPGPPYASDIGYDIKEVNENMPNYGAQPRGVVAGDLILTGNTNERFVQPPSGLPFRHDDMFLLAISQVTLTPINLTGRLFGGEHNGSYGYSLAQVGQSAGTKRGIIICGMSADALSQPLASNEYYVVKTDDAGHTGCDYTWTPSANPLTYWACLNPTHTELSLGETNVYQLWGADNDVEVCPRPVFPKLTPGIGQDDHAPVIGSSITSAPNPIERGQMSTLDYTAANDGNIVLTVADGLGKTVSHSMLDAARGKNAIQFDTHDLPAGVYMITIANGDDVQRTRVVVVNRR